MQKFVGLVPSGLGVYSILLKMSQNLVIKYKILKEFYVFQGLTGDDCLKKTRTHLLMKVWRNFLQYTSNVLVHAPSLQLEVFR